MIIVEGPDGAGKTTLVEKLLGKFPELTLGERSTTDRAKLKEHAIEDTHRAFAHELEHLTPHYLWDRMFISTLVYQPLTGGPKISDQDREYFWSILVNHTIPIIWCLPPMRDVMSNVADDDGQMQGVVKNIRRIYHSYAMWHLRAFDLGVPSIIYDYNNQHDLTTVYRQVGDYIVLRKEARRAKSLPSFSPLPQESPDE